MQTEKGTLQNEDLQRALFVFQFAGKLKIRQ